ncbi:FAD-dependent oxidoreductase [Aeromicrobium sp. 636]|uniref:NAD(P)/FAD-dependent oxidoreductase n=1 Tax=Aeromicrobium senzhongii TaxID=2663859 RepID=A0A8I0EUS2_9ACTN|nr:MULTISPECIES: FAD-dependent oxidoreductase [Aeromicrobium]MBC9225455.1 NAD(P)/FAD-dependent oxidoreductase [Aeromicrobium senzhongii]MCQ3997565.1 FAD-dependent oxidoreductase [Aeromicrobium sp. 636]
MARILVVGGGFAGMSAAARLAKLRHDVTVLERGAEPGGRLLGVPIGGDRWAAGPESVTLPGVFRDLFRKSGRPMDALIAISPAGPRHHVLPARWPRHTVTLDLPFGTRGAQHDAVVAAFGSDAWSPWVDESPDPWNELRRSVLEVAHPHDSPVPEVAWSDRSLSRTVRALRDPRLRRLAADLPGLTESAPGVLAVWHYVERNFGRWRFDGGSAGLATALTTRLRERKVTIETGVDVARPVDSGVELADGSIREADVVVWATGTDPLAAAPTPSLEHTAVRLDGAAEVPDDLVVHDSHVVRGWRSGTDGWVFEAPRGVDPLAVLARHGLDLTSFVTWRGSVPAPPTSDDLPRPARSPRPGLWLVGAAASPGASLEVTGMGTAALAEHLGAVPR